MPKLPKTEVNAPPTGNEKSTEQVSEDITLRSLIDALRDPIPIARALLLERKYFWHLAMLLLVGELALGLLIIWKVPYTKIDWPAYMQQVDGFLAGERDYSKLEGETGPLVYPALHLYIYTALHEFLPASDRVRPAQYLFLVIYLATLLASATIYYLAGRGGSRHFPQALLVPLTLSKRAHSIYLLRLFNDPFAMLFLYSAIILFMIGGATAWRIGSLVFSLALGVKMNILLFVPGLLVLLFQYRGLVGTLESVIIITVVQVLLPAPFFLSFENMDLTRSYFSSAFDFSREFLYKWTVNWAFVSEKRFLSREFAIGLLIAHLVVLLAFGLFKWSPVPGGTVAVVQRGLAAPRAWLRGAVPVGQLSSSHIPTVLFASNLIGMTFARSLHYQFHSWYFHQLPFILWAGAAWGDTVVLASMFALLERAWATAPATAGSSRMIFAVHLAMIGGLWLQGPRPSPRNKAE